MCYKWSKGINKRCQKDIEMVQNPAIKALLAWAEKLSQSTLLSNWSRRKHHAKSISRCGVLPPALWAPVKYFYMAVRIFFTVNVFSYFGNQLLNTCRVRLNDDWGFNWVELSWRFRIPDWGLRFELRIVLTWGLSTHDWWLNETMKQWKSRQSKVLQTFIKVHKNGVHSMFWKANVCLKLVESVCGVSRFCAVWI